MLLTGPTGVHLPESRQNTVVYYVVIRVKCVKFSIVKFGV